MGIFFSRLWGGLCRALFAEPRTGGGPAAKWLGRTRLQPQVVLGERQEQGFF